MDSSILEKDSVLSKFSSINLDLPVTSTQISENSSISSNSTKMKISGLAQDVTQEKWNFSLVLMETIVDTLLKVATSKQKLAQMRMFFKWKTSKYSCKLSLWVKLKETFTKLSSIATYLKRKKLMKALSVWNEALLVSRLRISFDSDLDELKNKYKLKLMAMSQEINDLNEKQLMLEKNSADYLQKEKSYKTSIRQLEDNMESKEASYDDLSALQNENLSLKAKLQSKESKLISYFEELSSMIDNAPSGFSK